VNRLTKRLGMTLLVAVFAIPMALLFGVLGMYAALLGSLRSAVDVWGSP